jgi:drug/metabolite transporter (DMT)-like permease
MFLLFVVSFVWAFSFGLIKGRLAGVDPTAVATLRLGLALLVFLPFLRLRGIPGRLQLKLAAIGAVQFGIMYVLYLRAFAFLQAYEVAVLTITTPLFVALIDGATQRRLHIAHAVAALLSVAGAAVIVWQRIQTQHVLLGILLVQLSNLCFAAGQLAWRHARAQLDPKFTDGAVFALPYAGALATSAAWSMFTTDWTALHLNWSQTATLVYLGVLASGVCFFWWNIGATRVNTGTLATFNNAKIPLAVACSLLFFGERANVPRLIIGGALIALGVVIAEARKPRLEGP